MSNRDSLLTRWLTYAFSLLGTGVLVASCVYFLPKTHRAKQRQQTGPDIV